MQPPACRLFSAVAPRLFQSQARCLSTFVAMPRQARPFRLTQVRFSGTGSFEGPGATAPQKPVELADFIEPLSGEHHIIETVLHAFEGYCIALRRGAKEADPKDLQKFVIFFREYIDQRHYKKEEGILLPALSGLLAAQGVQEIIMDHKKIRDGIAKFGQLCSAFDKKQVVKIGMDWITIVRIHMEKEDRGMFPVVCNVVPQSAVPAIAEKFIAEDAKWVARVKELEDMGFVLVRKYAQFVP